MSADDPLRIAFVSGVDTSAAARQSTRVWVDALRRRGHDVHSTSLSSRAAGRIALSAFDVIVGTGTSANVAALRAFRSGRPPLVVATEHEFVTHAGGRRQASRLLLARARHLYPSAARVVVPSHPVGAEMAARFGVPASRCVVVAPPILAMGEAATMPHTATTSRPRLVVPPSVSRDDADLVRRAAVLLRQGGTAVDVDLAPTTAGTEWTTRLVPGAIVVDPTRRTGSARALVEATHRRVPVVALSSAVGTADTVIPGVSGELALYDEPVEIAAAIDRARHLRVPVLTEWLSRFTAQASADAFTRVVLSARAAA